MTDLVTGLMGSAFAVFGCLLFVVLIAAIAILASIQIKNRERRIQDLKNYAFEQGLQFDAAGDYGHDERHFQFEIFQMGSKRRAFNTMYGLMKFAERDCGVVMGDFSYETTTGTGKKKRKTTRTFSYVIVGLPWDHVPEVVIRPENIFDRFAGFLGFDDIDFESSEFSRRFMVKSTDRKFTYKMIHPQMMEYMLQTKTPVIDMERAKICMTHGRYFVGSADFAEVLNWFDGFMSRWPKHLTKDLDEGLL